MLLAANAKEAGLHTFGVSVRALFAISLMLGSFGVMIFG
jgi:hypothetical protein